jgi:hypothetical protein
MTVDGVAVVGLHDFSFIGPISTITIGGYG